MMTKRKRVKRKMLNLKGVKQLASLFLQYQVLDWLPDYFFFPKLTHTVELGAGGGRGSVR